MARLGVARGRAGTRAARPAPGSGSPGPALRCPPGRGAVPAGSGGECTCTHRLSLPGGPVGRHRLPRRTGEPVAAGPWRSLLHSEPLRPHLLAGPADRPRGTTPSGCAVVRPPGDAAPHPPAGRPVPAATGRCLRTVPVGRGTGRERAARPAGRCPDPSRRAGRPAAGAARRRRPRGRRDVTGAVRDLCGRRFPAHLDTHFADEREGRYEHRYDRRRPWFTVDVDRAARDALRRRLGTPVDHHPARPGDSPQERRARRQEAARQRREEARRSRLAWVQPRLPDEFTCRCPPTCDELDDGNGRPLHSPN